MDFADDQHSLTFRVLAVLVLTVALAVPLGVVWVVVELRSEYELQVSHEISQGWGDDQILMGPFLHVQALTPGAHEEDGTQTLDVIHNYFFTPAKLSVNSASTHEIREKGIFKKPVFVSTIEFAGAFNFDPDEFAARKRLAVGDIQHCALLLTVSGSQAIRSLKGRVGERALAFEPSAQRLGWHGEPVSAALETAECGEAAFDLSLDVRGSNKQALALVGDESTWRLSSSWPHPKFEGRQLPDAHDITDTGFTANWTSNALARGFASELDQDEWFQISTQNVVGFAYHDPVTLYRMVTRAVKYGFFVVGLTLLAIFCVEMIANARIHPIQYGVVGASLALFYLLLLSFAEHIGFTTAFVLASAVLTLMITSYSWFSTRQVKFVASVGALLVAIYAALYLCLTSTDFALLIGSLMLVVLLIGLMFATRNLASRS